MISDHEDIREEQELITIIVPIYKVENFIHRCVNSMRSQSYTNLEIILVDDGSPDNCGAICDTYAKSDDRIKVIHKRNGGLSDARNYGLDIASGDYIAFLDSDDWIHEKHIEKLYELIKKTDSDIAVCDFLKKSTEDCKSDQIEETLYWYSNIEALEQLMDRFSTQLVVAWGKLYKQNLFENLRFPVGRLHEDVFITYKLIFRARKIALTTAPLYYYWQRTDSITGGRMNGKGYIDCIDAYTKRAEFFYEIGLKELSSRQFKQIFINYIDERKMIDKSIYPDLNNKLDSKLKELRSQLRKSRQKFIFRIFYEMYYILPDLLDIFYERHKKHYMKKIVSIP
jgi:glycosyltransferase involved in cell wall biosynthesis